MNPNTIFLLFILIIISNLSFIDHANNFTLKFVDVGQGDAILLRTPTNCTMLIDGGPLNMLTDQIYKHLPPLERKIDLLVLTHPHLDHLGGVIQILQRYDVENIFTTGVLYDSSFYDEFRKLIENKNVIYPTTGDKYYLCGILIEVIYPNVSLIGKEIENVNNASIVLKLTVKNHTIYLSGDAENEAEEQILQLNIDLKADIIKAGHHGSSTSTGEKLLEAVQPQEIVIQSGEGNTYNHPHYQIIESANERGIKVRRNDNEGTISYFF